jgi:hypothetical protein
VPIITGQWATVADATELTGDVPSAQDMVLAQSMIQNRIRRVYRTTDADRPEYVWLRTAVAYQASYVSRNPKLYAQAEIASTGQDGWSISYRDGIAPRSYHPEALNALNCLPGAANVTVRWNSGFQSSGGRRRAGLGRWRRY